MAGFGNWFRDSDGECPLIAIVVRAESEGENYERDQRNARY
jgi:hypothetical protein